MRITPRVGQELPPGTTLIDVEIGPLASFCSPDRIDFVKIDVEGAEPIVIRGCLDILNKHKPLIMSEVHVDQRLKASKSTPDDYFKIVEAIGYEVDYLTSEGKIGEKADQIRMYGVLNVVFVPH